MISLFVLALAITSTAAEGDCSCKDFITHEYGNCGRYYNGTTMCYVNQPSTCSDVKDSGSNPGEQYSKEACEGNPCAVDEANGGCEQECTNIDGVATCECATGTLNSDGQNCDQEACNVDDGPGDGTAQGTCSDAGQMCNDDGTCGCKNPDYVDADGTKQGTCPDAGQICNIDGTCGYYACEKTGCKWTDYERTQDWDYYDEEDGDCKKCQAYCDADPNCGAVECGGTYCSWWKSGKCSPEEATVEDIYMCRKGSDGENEEGGEDGTDDEEEEPTVECRDEWTPKKCKKKLKKEKCHKKKVKENCQKTCELCTCPDGEFFDGQVCTPCADVAFLEGDTTCEMLQEQADLPYIGVVACNAVCDFIDMFTP